MAAGPDRAGGGAAVRRQPAVFLAQDPPALARDPRPGGLDLRAAQRAGLGGPGRPLVRQGGRRAGRARRADRRPPRPELGQHADECLPERPGHVDQRAGDGRRHLVWGDPGRPGPPDRRRAAGLLCPGRAALQPDRPPDAVPGDGRGDAGLGRADLRGPRRARDARRPPGARPIVRPRGALAFRDVSFAYRRMGRPSSTGSTWRSSRG